tara:strand:- start:1472 stop:1984 length:513 start_codon:yes stop_codon:yes gene_type:complete
MYQIDENNNILHDDDPKVIFCKIAIYLSTKIVCLGEDTLERIIEYMFNSGILTLLEKSVTFRQLKFQNWIHKIDLLSDMSWWTEYVSGESSYDWEPSEEIVLWAILFESMEEYELSNTDNTLFDIYTQNVQYYCDPRSLGRSWYNDITLDFKESMRELIRGIDDKREMQA